MNILENHTKSLFGFYETSRTLISKNVNFWLLKLNWLNPAFSLFTVHSNYDIHFDRYSMNKQDVFMPASSVYVFFFILWLWREKKHRFK